MKSNPPPSLQPLTEKRLRRLTDEYVGKKFNLLTVIEILGRDKNGHVHCVTLCDCENDARVRLINIKNQTTKSCGCLRSKASRRNFQNYYASFEEMRVENERLKAENERLKKENAELFELMEYFKGEVR